MSELIYMMFFRMKIGCDLPYLHWFIESLYEKYNSTSQAIDLNSLKTLMHDLGLNETKSNKSVQIEPFLDIMRVSSVRTASSFNKVISDCLK